MNREMEYLSEESLELLIAEVEQKELVSAPPGIREEILDRIAAEENNRKQKEFYRYCFRVIASMAAAVVIIFSLPYLKGSSEEFMTQNMESGEAENRIFGNVLGETRIFDEHNRFEIFSERKGE